MKNDDLYCIHCGRDITKGDLYFDVDGEPWCEQCITDAQKVRGENDGMD